MPSPSFQRLTHIYSFTAFTVLLSIPSINTHISHLNLYYLHKRTHHYVNIHTQLYNSVFTPHAITHPVIHTYSHHHIPHTLHCHRNTPVIFKSKLTPHTHLCKTSTHTKMNMHPQIFPLLTHVELNTYQTLTPFTFIVPVIHVLLIYSSTAFSIHSKTNIRNA